LIEVGFVGASLEARPGLLGAPVLGFWLIVCLLKKAEGPHLAPLQPQEICSSSFAALHNRGYRRLTWPDQGRKYCVAQEISVTLPRAWAGLALLRNCDL
jgi:hypothetical protein